MPTDQQLKHSIRGFR